MMPALSQDCPTPYQNAVALWEKADALHLLWSAGISKVSQAKAALVWAMPAARVAAQLTLKTAEADLHLLEVNADDARRLALDASSEASYLLWGVSLGVRYRFNREGAEHSRFMVDYLRPTGAQAGPNGFICSGPRDGGRLMVLLGTDDLVPQKLLAEVYQLRAVPLS